MILVVQSEWNKSITDRLSEAAIKEIKSAQLESEHVLVPGALEIPLAIKWAWAHGQRIQKPLTGAVALGCVVKGDTYHFDLVANDCSQALSQLALELRIPIGHGVLAVYDTEQAIKRSGDESNKGIEAAKAVIDMLKVKTQIESKQAES